MSTPSAPIYPVATGQPIIVLKEGTSRNKGKDAMQKNILAAKTVADIVRSSLGPRGMDKMLVDSLGDVVITNDGATMLKEMEIEHPAAKMMVEAAKTQDAEVGDGTTSVVVLAGALLENAEKLIERKVHPTIIIDGFKKAADKAIEVLKNISIKVDRSDRDMLRKVAMTAMHSKLVSGHREYLANIAVDAIMHVTQESDGEYRIDLDDVKIEKKPGGSIKDTLFVKGIVLDKEVVHSGMPKRIEDAKIALLNTPLEIEKTEFDARINITNPEQMKLFLEEEHKMLKEMVDKIKEAGANVVICQKGIDDVAQHYLAKSGILAVRRVKQSDMEKLAKATGGRIVNNIQDLTSEDLGEAELVEERKIEDDKWVFIEGCKNPRSVTILVRGGSERVVDEAERSLKDALSVVRDVVIRPEVVAGGGAVEAEVAKEIRRWANKLGGREQLAANAFADALEVIPNALAENAGLDTIDIEVKLKSAHSEGKLWHGVDVFTGEVTDMKEKEVYEPALVKEQLIKAATEVSSMILRIDDVIAASKLKEEGKGKGPKGPEEYGGYGGEE